MAAHPVVDRIVRHGDRLRVLHAQRESAGRPALGMAGRETRGYRGLDIHDASRDRSAAHRLLSGASRGSAVRGAVDRLVERALPAGWRVLDSGRMDADPHARYGARRRPDGQTPAAAVPDLLAGVDPARHRRFRLARSRVLPHGREARMNDRIDPPFRAGGWRMAIARAA